MRACSSRRQHPTISARPLPGEYAVFGPAREDQAFGPIGSKTSARLVATPGASHKVKLEVEAAGMPRSPARPQWEGRIVNNPLRIIGILLIVLGLVALAYQGITYTKSEKVLEVGPITATKETKLTIPLPPVLGGVALLGGVVLLVASSSRRP